MKKTVLTVILLISLVSCSTLPESITEGATDAQTKAPQTESVSALLTAEETAPTEVTDDTPVSDAQTDAPVVPVKKELPCVYITTEGGADITSKKDYVSGVIEIDGDMLPMRIRGRGNASWNTFPKKGYRIKLDEGARLLGMKRDRDWVLVSAYPDKTLIRNTVAHTMASQLDGLEFTPVHVLTEVYINGDYRGVYTLAEKIEFGGGKLEYEAQQDVYDTSYLFEVGWDYNDDMVYGLNYFDTKYIERIVVKEPDMSKRYSDQMKYIIEYMNKAEAAVIALDGYEEYIDVDSFIDYLIILELTNNTESAFYRSCYFYKPQGGLLKMGPVWDFDMAFGNHSRDIKGYDGWAASESDYSYLGYGGVTWYTFLMKDPAFTSRLAARWDEVKDKLLKAALDTIEESVDLLSDGVERNFEKWDILDKKIGLGNVDPKTYNTYELQIEYLKNFIINRYGWIDEAISEFRLQ